MAIDKDKILANVQKLLAKNAVDKALKELQMIVREDPKDLRVRQKIAELLARQGNVAEAMREFQVVAEAYERGGFYPKAAAIYKQMLRFEPNSMRWHLSLGEIYLQLALMSDAADHFNIVARHSERNGTSQERIDIYQKLLRLNPDNLEYAEKLADVYLKEGDAAAAADVWKGLVPALEGREDWDNLTRVLERLSALKPEDIELIQRLANHYLDRGDPKRALAKLQHCFKANPQDTETLNLLADAFSDLGEKDKAVAVLKELAQIYDSLGYLEYKNQVWDRIADLDPAEGGATSGGALETRTFDDPILALNLLADAAAPGEVAAVVAEVMVLLEYALEDRARRVLGDGVARFPQHWVLRRQLAAWLIADEEIDAAREQIDAMYELAMDQSDYDAARACLSRACDLDPGDEASRARLRAFEEAVGESDLEVDDEAGDMGAALDLGARIGSANRKAAGQQVDEDLLDEEDHVDDEELQKLARKLQAEGGPGARPAPRTATPAPAPAGRSLPPPSDDDDDPFSGLDDLGSIDGNERLSAFDLGMSYYKLGHWDDALAEFRRAVDEDDHLSEALEHVGLCLRRLRDFRGAAESFRRLLQERLVAGEVAMKVMFELGVTYEAAGDRKSAYKVYRRIADQDRDFRDGEVLNRVESLALELGIRE